MQAHARSAPAPVLATARVRWATTIRLLGAILALTWLITMSILSPPPPPWVVPLVLYLTLRGGGDAAEAFRGHTTDGSLAEALLKAAAWGFLPLGVQWAALPTAPHAPAAPWIVGLILLFFGLGLAAHHDRARSRTPRAARLAAVAGLLLSVPGAALSASGLPLAAPWRGLTIAATALAALALAFIALPRRSDTDHRAGLGGWWRQHRMRLTLAAVAVIAYLPARTHIERAAGTTWIPFLEYAGAVALAGFLFWSLRAHLTTTSTESPLTSPYRRHEPALRIHSEAELDEWEHAFGTFLADGDTRDLRRLSARLEAETDVPAKRIMQPLLSYRPPEGILLVHPFWPYLATVGSLIVLVLALARFAATMEPLVGDLAHALAPTALAIGLYVAQFNRNGGPWWVKTLIAYAALAIVPFLEIPFASAGMPGPLNLLFTPLGILIALGLLALPLIHAAHARRAHERALYLYRGDDPSDAVRSLVARSERSLLLRSLTLALIAVPVFIATGEIAAVYPPAAAFLPLYLLFAGLLVMHPLILSIGLRLGREHVRRLAQRETRERERRHEEAVTALTRALTTE